MSDSDYLIENIAKDIILLLMEDFNMDMKTALHTLYTSDTYTKLQDTKTGLIFRVHAMFYDFLKNEIKSGKMS